MRIEAADPHLKRGKHATTRLRNDHLGALRMKLIPQRFSFQYNNGLRQRWMHWLRFLTEFMEHKEKNIELCMGKDA